MAFLIEAPLSPNAIKQFPDSTSVSAVVPRSYAEVCVGENTHFPLAPRDITWRQLSGIISKRFHCSC